jgi:protein phosphatase
MERAMRTIASSLPQGEVPRRFAETGTVMMVADGMGGAAAGEVASRTAITALVNMILDVPDWIMKADEKNAARLMKRAVKYYRALHEEIRDAARSRPGLAGMGTTMTVAYAVGRSLFVAHVGDSRAYLLRDGELRQLTRDHTHVQHLVESGVLSRDEAGTHHLRHVLTNALGGEAPGGGVDMHRIDLHRGDTLLLCSDGLTAVVRDSEIAEVLGRDGPPEFACRTLIDVALERQAPDNVTVVVGRCQVDKDEP